MKLLNGSTIHKKVKMITTHPFGSERLVQILKTISQSKKKKKKRNRDRRKQDKNIISIVTRILNKSKIKFYGGFKTEV